MYDSLDSIRLEGALTRHPSGIYLLAAPKRFEDGERISDLTVMAVFNLMRQLFDFVIVDCGQRIDENVVAAWERSDEVLYVIDPSLIGGTSESSALPICSRQLGLARDGTALCAE